MFMKHFLSTGVKFHPSVFLTLKQRFQALSLPSSKSTEKIVEFFPKFCPTPGARVISLSHHQLFLGFKEMLWQFLKLDHQKMLRMLRRFSTILRTAQILILKKCCLGTHKLSESPHLNFATSCTRTNLSLQSLDCKSPS